MRALIQRVTHASVVVAGDTVGKIDAGILAYIGLGHDDDFEHAKRMVDKLLAYRIFCDTQGKLSLNVQQTQGGVLLVSQFTLLANTAKGLRPDFKPAMPYHDAQVLFGKLCSYAKDCYAQVATGAFGADMQVTSVNDGPINFLLEI